MKRKWGDLKEIYEIYAYYIKLKKYIFISAILMVFSSIVTLPIPFINQIIVDKVITNKNFNYMYYIVPIWIVILIIAPMLNSIKSYFVTLFELKFDKMIRRDLINKVLHLPIRYFGENKAGYIQNRIETDIKNLHAISAGKMLNILNKIVLMLFGLIMMLQISIKMTICVLAVLPVVILNSYLFSNKVKLFNKKVSESWSELTGIITQRLMGIETIKLYTMEDKVVENLDERNSAFVKVTTRKVKLDLFSNVIKSILTGLESLIIWTYGSILITHNVLSLGQVVAFIGYCAYVYGPALQLANIKLDIQPVIAAWERIRDILNMDNEDKHEGEKPELNVKSGKIEFENVSFSYNENNQVLNQVNLIINGGENVMITGQNGSGKSTLVKLITRLYTNYTGIIRIDNQDISNCSIYSLRKQISFVSQNIFLFSGTVIENIRISVPGMEDNEIKKILFEYQLDEMIKMLPNGYETMITENGSNLSGGQKQYISILRSVIRRQCKIIIYDEATSALDKQIEAKVIQSLRNLVMNKTFIFITHKNYVENYQRQIQLVKGTVQEI